MGATNLKLLKWQERSIFGYFFWSSNKVLSSNKCHIIPRFIHPTKWRRIVCDGREHDNLQQECSIFGYLFWSSNKVLSSNKRHIIPRFSHPTKWMRIVCDGREHQTIYSTCFVFSFFETYRQERSIFGYLFWSSNKVLSSNKRHITPRFSHPTKWRRIVCDGREYQTIYSKNVRSSVISSGHPTTRSCHPTNATLLRDFLIRPNGGGSSVMVGVIRQSTVHVLSSHSLRRTVRNVRSSVISSGHPTRSCHPTNATLLRDFLIQPNGGGSSVMAGSIRQSPAGTFDLRLFLLVIQQTPHYSEIFTSYQMEEDRL
ncbi:uncharacterized protein [Panulirus ornatus]|uniref:uncharacterized protein isoform X2 n=1 Tax=Panulirus ornatus TaxID=150431 RepID=UPI003A8B95EB